LRLFFLLLSLDEDSRFTFFLPIGNRQRNASQARKQILDLIAAHPELLQGPIVASSEEAVLARPIENLRKLGTR